MAALQLTLLSLNTHNGTGSEQQQQELNTTTTTFEEGEEKQKETSPALLITHISNIIWYVFPPVLLTLGTFGNVTIVTVMRRLRTSEPTACLSVYFTALALSDQCLLTSVLWLWVDGLFTWPPEFFQFDLLCTFPHYVWYSCGQCSAWFLVSMTYQRVTSVVLPHRVGVLCTVGRGKTLVGVIAAVVLALNSHYFFTVTYHERDECMPKDRYAYFVYVYTLFDMVFGSIIPFLLLIIGNSILISQVVSSMKISRRIMADTGQAGKVKVYPMTRTLILTSSAFLSLTLPVSIFDAYERTLDYDVIDDDEYFAAMINLGDALTEMMWFTTCSTNFYLYLLSGRKFREEAKKCLGWH